MTALPWGRSDRERPRDQDRQRRGQAAPARGPRLGPHAARQHHARPHVGRPAPDLRLGDRASRRADPRRHRGDLSGDRARVLPALASVLPARTAGIRRARRGDRPPAREPGPAGRRRPLGDHDAPPHGPCRRPPPLPARRDPRHGPGAGGRGRARRTPARLREPAVPVVVRSAPDRVRAFTCRAVRRELLRHPGRTRPRRPDVRAHSRPRVRDRRGRRRDRADRRRRLVHAGVHARGDRRRCRTGSADGAGLADGCPRLLSRGRGRLPPEPRPGLRTPPSRSAHGLRLRARGVTSPRGQVLQTNS